MSIKIIIISWSLVTGKITLCDYYTCYIKLILIFNSLISRLVNSRHFLVPTNYFINIMISLLLFFILFINIFFFSNT